MKKIQLLLMFVFCIAGIRAQDNDSEYRSEDEFKTIFGGKKVGGYGAVGLGYTKIEDRHAIIFDARGGVVLGHSLTLGIAGAGFINSYVDSPSLNADVSLVGGYGGILIEPILLPRSGVHLSFPMIGGIGSVAHAQWSHDGNDGSNENSLEESAMFLVFEPGIELEFNVLKFFRITAFTSYRFTSNLELESTEPDALEYYSMGIRLKFGKF